MRHFVTNLSQMTDDAGLLAILLQVHLLWGSQFTMFGAGNLGQIRHSSGTVVFQIQGTCHGQQGAESNQATHGLYYVSNFDKNQDNWESFSTDF